MNSLRLRSKFLLVIVGMAAFMGIVLTVFVQSVVSNKLSHEFRKLGIAFAEQMASANANAILTGDFRSIKLNIVDMKREHSDSLEYIFIIDRNKKLIAHTFANSFPIDLITANNLANGSTLSIQPIIAGGKRIDDIAIPSLGNGFGEVHIGMKSEVIRSDVHNITYRITAVILCVLFVCFLVAIIFSLRISNSISALAQAAHKMEGGDLTFCLEAKDRDEIGTLYKAFADMCKGIREREERLHEQAAKLEDEVAERQQAQESLEEQTAQLEEEVAERQQTQESLEEQTAQLEQEIADREQTEGQLRTLSQRLQLATSSAQLGVWDLNIRENTMVWDDRMFEMYGITREAFPSCVDAWMNGLHPDDRERAIAEFQAVLSGDQEYNTVFRVLHPDGTVKYIKAHGLVKMGSDGTSERMIGIDADITDTIKAEEDKDKLEAQLQQAQKMESVGRLAGGIAHDFNNLLTVILGRSELALRKVEATDPLADCLIEIQKAAERSAGLTRQLLAFARKQTIMPKILDLNDAVSGMLKIMQRLIGENIQLAWLPAKNLWKVYFDPSQVDQILANLCVNARDAIADVGKISIETGNITFDETFCTNNIGYVPGEYVLFAVSDNGCGMDKETVAHIFEPFYTTKDAGQGTGLGLSTVYGVVKQNNGFINCYSEPGLGTTFNIYLPRYMGQPEKHLHRDRDIVPKSRGETLLLVDDNPSIVDTATKMLEALNYTVLTAVTPDEALQVAKEHTGGIHLLVTDLIMPKMNGRDLARKILSTCPDMKLLFMSGYTADIITQESVLEEGVYFIQKPFSLSSIADKVREALNS
ncbi:MAG: ATP-binding protein [Oryzomonas sp.]|uniref:ATP-binding protein n=1 Tax=Oryzomonas sp. TaxID=2855186 RepID=UPI00284EAA97|nr:ATP-binding protein [Oryzomonas sp.]MDR3579761.1 ATP-binding protein [Oryzomonas sp.]